ncbi:PucR family transcriptional regulator [Nocardia sp. CA-128927]|uniref:PucR family transcriptional regulator n=1 Tax=Nocardia sp. CA-128927 TaxID=3239975 RepID=UPI003D997448
MTARASAMPRELVEYGVTALTKVDELAAELSRRVIAAEAELAVGVLVPAEDAYQVCVDMLTEFYRYLAGEAPLDPRVVRGLGRRRAEQGVPLSAVLHGFRIGGRFIWETLAATADLADRRHAEAVLSQATVLWTVLDDYSTELREAYGEAVASRTRQQQTERNHQLDTLLKGGSELGARWAAADALGLAKHGQFQVMIVDEPAPETDHICASALTRGGIASVWRVSSDQLAAVLTLGPRASAQDLDKALAGVQHAGVGVSPVFEQISDAGLAHQRARIAAACASSGTAEVRHYGDDPIATLASTASDTARYLAVQVLGSVFALPEHERASLLETLRAWFTAGGSTDVAATALFCHRNTVRYRLRHLEELTGRRLTDPRDAAQLYLAVETVVQHDEEGFVAEKS